jgi:hypothetical protein
MKYIIPKAVWRFFFLGLIIIGLLLGSAEVPRTDYSFVGDAEARVGRPGTPRSVAGVSRRTTRRTVRRHVALGTRVTILPVGYRTRVVRGTTFYVYEEVCYEAFYEGNTVVYVVIDCP